MCRLFGFRSNSATTVHRSLVRAQNSLQQQSIEHKDGWGIAYYVEGHRPQVAHGLGAAHADPEFERVSSLVSSHAVLAHVRLASVGPVHLYNAHPFVHGAWSFAHNGTVREFERYRKAFEAEIDPDLRELIRGDTDSERCFYLFLTFLRDLTNERMQAASVEEVAKALSMTAQLASRISAESADPKPTSLNLMATDGRVMAATRRHRTLFYSEGRQNGVVVNAHPQPGMPVSKLVIASEALTGEDHWHEVPEDGVIGLEGDLTFRRWSIAQLAAP